MRLLGLSVPTSPEMLAWPLRDLATLERLLRGAPRQLDRLLTLAEELVDIGQRVLVIAERLDARAEAIFELGLQLEKRAEEMLDLGAHMQSLGGQIDLRGAEIVERAAQVVETGSELITALPMVERALELATPLEGAIDRFGRIVDRFPGNQRDPAKPAQKRGRSTKHSDGSAKHSGGST